MKKLIALLLMLAMVLSAMSMSVFAAEEETEKQRVARISEMTQKMEQTYRIGPA